MPAARGLFHRAIVESGSLLHLGDRGTGTAVARAVLAGLELDESRVDELVRVPATDLHTARLALCQATRQVIANGLAILGVRAPERM